MLKLEQVLQKFYAFLVGLYPRQFRQDFEEEMNMVFGEALSAAHRSGLWAMLQLCSREVSDLPGALFREYWQPQREKEVEMRKNNQPISNRGNADPISERKVPTYSWREIFLAVLPFLLIMLLEIIPKLLVETGLLTWEAPAMQVLNTGLSILLGVTFLLILFVGWRQKWPLWSASWYLYFVLALFGLAQWLITLLSEDEHFEDVISQGLLLYLVFPLIVAVLLYAATRLDRVRGLLAVLPILYLLWWPNMEFVPDPIEVSIKVASTALICLAIVSLLRQGDWRLGLYAILAVNLVVGLLFSYAGTYHGGTLPFSAPGPSLVEVVKSLIPQYLATSAILLGPLFARKFRQDGLAGGRTGRVGYHLALVGLLLVILANLASLMMELESPAYAITSFFSRRALTAVIVLGLGIYILGLLMLYRDARFTKATSGWVERFLLSLLPLALPIALMLPFIDWRWPVSNLYGIPLLWELPRALTLSFGFVWLALSIWLITRGSEYSSPHASLAEASEAASLS